MPTNDFLPFGTAVGANVMAQTDYVALAARSNGFSSGTAASAQLNKAWRQSSIIASMLAQFIADQSGQNAVDDGTTTTLEANLLTAIRAAGRQTTVLTDTGTANAYAAVNTPALAALPITSGYSQRVNIANANTGASTYAPDGLAAKPVYGLALQPLQGGELPAGIAVMMYLVQSGVNGGNGAWIIIESLGGAQQIPSATKSMHAIPLAQMAAVTGGVRNGKMAVSTASATATFTADEVAVKTTLGGASWLLSNLSKTINVAITGIGGMDTGSAPASGWLAFYLCFNPLLALSSTNPMIIGQNATSAVATNIYGGVNMPTGYTASALIGAWRTTAASLLDVGYLTDRKVITIPTSVLSFGTTPGAFTSLVISGGVPPNAKSAGFSFSGLSATAGTTQTLLIAADANGAGQQTSVSSTSVANNGTTSNATVMIVTPQTIYWKAVNTGGTPLYSLSVVSYDF